MRKDVWRRTYAAAAVVVTLCLCAAICAEAVGLYLAAHAPENLGTAGVPLVAAYAPERITAAGRRIVWLAAAWAALMLGGWAAHQYARPKAVRQAPLRMGDSEKSTRRAARVRLALLLAALLFIVLGVVNGGAHDVLVKAINICTECIGLG